MSIHLFGHRVLLKYEKPKELNSRIVIPDVAGKNDLNRMGRVAVVGDGRTVNHATGQKEQKQSLVKEGDLVMFQINDVMKWAQTFRHLKDDFLHVLQEELIARINGDSVNLDTFEILGSYVLVKPEVRRMVGDGTIVLPDTIRAAEMIHYTAIQKGSTVDAPFEPGQEIICNHARVNPIFIPVRQKDKSYKQEEFGYIFKDFVVGVDQEADVPLQA